MELITSIRKAIDFMENNLEKDINANDVSKHINYSLFLLERSFSMVTNYSIMEYLRSRRLYQAAVDITKTNEKIIDIAYKYCYETPESFTKAFTRFHNVTPTQVRSGSNYKVFLPLTININIIGGDKMDYIVKTMPSFKVIGIQRVFDNETAYKEIPKFWDEVMDKYFGKEPSNEFEKAINKYCIGEYGICIDDLDNGKFRYLIAGIYNDGDIPSGMVVYEFKEELWAIFNCYGPLPNALQSVNTRIYKEWLPGNPDYELSGVASIEWYDTVGNTLDNNYHSKIMIPVIKK